MAQLNRNPISVRRLDAYRVALELLEYVETLLPRIRSKAPAQADQLDRACPSIPQNLGEGMRRTGRDRAHLLTVSLGSAEERSPNSAYAVALSRIVWALARWVAGRVASAASQARLSHQPAAAISSTRAPRAAFFPPKRFRSARCSIA